jgi:hypothetical protein
MVSSSRPAAAASGAAGPWGVASCGLWDPSAPGAVPPFPKTTFTLFLHPSTARRPASSDHAPVRQPQARALGVGPHRGVAPTNKSNQTIPAGTMADANADTRQSAQDLYELVQVIGKGSFGTVSKIRRKTDGRVRGRGAVRGPRTRAPTDRSAGNDSLPPFSRARFSRRSPSPPPLHPRACRSWCGRSSTTAACARRRSSSSSPR